MSYLKNCDFRVFNDYYTLALTEYAFQHVIKSGLCFTERLPNGIAIRVREDSELQVTSFGPYYLLTMSEKGLNRFRDAVGNSQVPLIQKLLDYIQQGIEQVRANEGNYRQEEYDEEPLPSYGKRR